MPKPNAVAVVGDLHAGSTVGLMPPSFKTVSGQILVYSDEQKWLWERWLELCAWYGEYELDALILNGDLPNGINARDAENLGANESDQINLVVAALKPLLYVGHKRRVQNVYVTRGTGYHAGAASWREEQIAKWIGAVCDKNGAYSRYVNDLTWRGRRLVFTHHINTASVYPLTPLQRAQRDWRVRCQAKGTRMPDVDIRGHVHTSYAYESNDNKWIGTLPSWQLLTQHAHRVVPMAEQDLVTGGGLIWLDENGKVILERRLYRLPETQGMEIPTT